MDGPAIITASLATAHCVFRAFLHPAAKQQVQDLQAERRQLQKKLAACKQQLTDVRAAHDGAQQELLLLRHATAQHAQRQAPDQPVADAAEKAAAATAAAASEQQRQQQE